MQPRKKGRPPTLQRKNRTRQKQTAQLRHRQLHQHLLQEHNLTPQQRPPEIVHADESPGYSFDDTDDPSASTVWVPEPAGQISTPMTVVEVEGAINDPEEPFWPTKRPHVSEDAAASSTSQLPFHNQNVFTASPDKVQQLHQLHQCLSPAGARILPESAAIKQELLEMQQQPEPSGQHIQRPSHRQSRQQTPRIQQALSAVNEEQLLQTYHQETSQGLTTRIQDGLLTADQPQQLPQNQHSLPPRAPSIPNNTNVWSVPSSLALPHTLAEPSHVTADLASSSQQQGCGQTDTALRRTYSDESIADEEIYVRQAAEIAEKAKLEHRIMLKESQRSKELEADARGEPMSAKDKERERSRRESAVTRKRAEIYIHQLERTARKVPLLEKRIEKLLAEVELLRRAHPQRQQHPLPVASAMSAIPCSEAVKSEPGLVARSKTML